ncbi:hypothetical protein AB4455_03050 [Vibrio sp. 10N.261.46.E12]|uniref:hypothetical protein n=1 Tax=unclassified Vibrio TaxID=2614977 RepID=UPI000977C295|nr:MULTISPECIES: hypothetical protein [unclassified Vibrio]OMO37682.1 hypothetical protein BH584_21520 [Vibrio sp. 10N.261.45.E1]PMJ26260.1 hypothetical protein BCU27_09520 [Vibrio sp. 10N.286.45.B6]PML86989.1 hypothetical protein BCT66_13100 [Vibrio sp. 10N.261.49.E11]PMM78646.1 hypothetical protein BCT48_01135 [Vibrio sp. 10N.261.46.F12]PMM85766.1 hypothetical protein BCT46_08880 [Vibrio sp. 10N.261.46.E8]
MSEKLIQLRQELVENPYVTFDSDGKGVSRVFDLAWDFHALNQNEKTISFRHLDEKYCHDIQSYLYALMQWQKEKSNPNSHFAVSTLLRTRGNLNTIATRWGKSDFSLLSSEREWKRCRKTLHGVGNEGTCRHIASVINAFNKAGLVTRYVNKREYIKWVNPDADDGQAIAFPEAIHVSILKTVVEFVETYHPYRHQISEAMEKLYTYQDEMFSAELRALDVSALTDRQMMTFSQRMSRRISKWPERQAIPNFSFHRKGNWLGAMLRMCFICVGLFSAARKEELLSMNKESYDDSLAAVPKVSGFSTKGNKGEKIYTTWNTAPIAKLALELAYDATQAARKYSLERLDDGYQKGQLTQDQYNAKRQDLESAFISSDIPYDSEALINKSSLKYRVYGTDDALNLKEFNIIATAEDVEEFDLLNPDRAGSLKVGGGLPKLSPHDLRRSFVVFMVKNRLGNALTVKYQLKHRNINMSNWYANYSELARTNQLLMDTQLMSEFDEAIESSAVNAWDEIYNVSDTLSGAEGERIAQNKAERLAQGEGIVMSRSELLALVRSGDKSIVLLPTGGYCTNRNCERLCSLMDIVEAPCEHKVVTDKAAKRLSREREKLIASFRAINDMGDYANELILDARKKKIQSIEPTLVKHSIPFDSFNDDIKAVWS